MFRSANTQPALYSALWSVVLTAALFVVLSATARAEIYVVVNKDGSKTFTSRQPKPGTNAEVFKPKSVAFSVYKVHSYTRSKLFKNEFQEHIDAAADAKGLDANLIKAVIHAESAFNPRARSRAGAMGLMQLMPGTAKLVGVRDPYEPRQNIFGGSSYLKTLLERFRGDLRLTLAAYNAGPEAVANYNGVPPYRETREYVKKVIDLHRAYKLRS